MSKLKKIMYIDDQMDILVMAEYALTEIGGYDVLICESGAQALAKIDAKWNFLKPPPQFLLPPQLFRLKLPI